MSAGWQVGVDIGGTFTDVVAVDPASGAVRTAKVATRTDDRVAGLLAATADGYQSQTWSAKHLRSSRCQRKARW